MKKSTLKNKLVSVIFFALCIFIPSFVGAEDVVVPPPVLPDTSPIGTNIHGHLEAEGTHFTITDSTYLNVILDSTETIKLKMDSVPEMVTLMTESALVVSSSQITMSGFLPNTTYYLYQNDYHNLTTLTTDNNGTFSYTQDLTIAHIIFIQPRHSTRFIKDDATGGDCAKPISPIGTWDATTKTCTLNIDLTETIQIDSNNITLDGNGHVLTGYNTGNGVYLYGKSGVAIRNLNVKSFTYGIYLYNSSNNTLVSNVTNSNRSDGVYIYGSNNILTNNTANSNGNNGITLTGSTNSRLTDNTAQENWYYDVYIFAATDSQCNNTIVNTTGSGGKPIKYFNNAVTLSNETLAQLILCNADGSNINNIRIEGSATFPNNSLYLLRTDFAKIINVNSSNNSSGIELSYSNNNTLESNVVQGNFFSGFFIGYSYYNSFTNNVISNHNIGVNGSNNNTFTNNTVTSNNVGLSIGGENTLVNNIVRFNNYGLGFNGDRNTLNRNTFSDNNNGIIGKGYQNKMYQNNLINNSTQITFFSGARNLFDLPSPIGGNYWSNFDTPAEGCTDANTDGFCDAPYTFTGGQDNMPWTKKDGWIVPVNPTLSDLGQYKMFGVDAVAEGETFIGNTAVFKAKLSDPNNGNIKMEVEVKKADQPFDGTNTIFSNLVGSGEIASTTVNDLIPKDDQYVAGGNTTSFHWRVRAVNNNGNMSDWQEFGTAGNTDFTVKVVALWTQAKSNYPVRDPRDEWEGEDYASGVDYDCGNKKDGTYKATIGSCGCAITSLAMLGHYYGIEQGLDSTDVSPLNINSWLKSHGGYVTVVDSKGKQIPNVLSWQKGISYLGKYVGSQIKSPFEVVTVPGGNGTRTTHIKDVNLVDQYLSSQPVFGFKNAIGHYFVLTSKVANTYTIRDPYFYNTQTLNQIKDGTVSNVYGYNNSFSFGTIIKHLDTPKVVQAYTTMYLASPAEILVTDPQGRRVGYDPHTGVGYSEIPDASYDYEQPISDSETDLDTSQIHEIKTLTLPTLTDGSYDVQVIGTGTGDYTFITSMTDDGGNTTQKVFIASTTPDQVDTYDYEITPNGQNITLPLTATANNQTITLGSSIPTLTAALSGFATSTPNDVTGSASCSTTATAASSVGSYPITCTAGTLASNNYSFKTFVAGTLSIIYRFDGFQQPINDTAHQQGTASVFKAGSTILVKFQIKKADGTVVQSVTSPQWLTPQQGGLMSSAVNESVFTDAADTSSTFLWNTDHYQYNWSTKGLQAGYWYKIFAKLDDGGIQSVIVGLR